MIHTMHRTYGTEIIYYSVFVPIVSTYRRCVCTALSENVPEGQSMGRIIMETLNSVP